MTSTNTIILLIKTRPRPPGPRPHREGSLASLASEPGEVDAHELLGRKAPAP